MSWGRVVDGMDDDGANHHFHDPNELGGKLTDFTGKVSDAQSNTSKQHLNKKKKKKMKNKSKQKRRKNQSDNEIVNNSETIENEEIVKAGQRKSSCFPHEQTAPWLMYFSHGKNGKFHTLYSIETQKSYKKNIPLISGKTCLLFAHGWLLLQDWKTGEVTLLNPLSMERIDFPAPPKPTQNDNIYNDRYHSWFVTAPPTNESCIILITYHSDPFFIFCYVHEKKWHKTRYHMGEEGGLQNFAICNDVIYGLTGYNTLCVINFDLYNITIKSPFVPEPFVPFSGIKNSFCIGGFGGDLYSVFFIEIYDTWLIVNFNVFKMDFIANKWTKVNSIGEKTFFVDIFKKVVICCADNVPGVKKDCIYYTGFDDILYRYDLTTRGITMESSFRHLKDPLYMPCWILPM